MQRLTLAGGERVRVVTAGPEGAPAVLLVHGWACLAYAWRFQCAALAAAGHRAVAPDLRGHGFSDKPLDDARYTPDALAAQLLAVADALGLGRMLVVGHSMGGAVALRLAALHPDRVAGLVLAAPVGFGGVNRTRWLRALTPAAVEPFLQAFGTRFLFALGLRTGYGTLGRPTERDVDEYFAASADPRLLPALRRVAHAFDWDVGPAASFDRVVCPVHVLFGERDGVIRERVARPALARLARATAEVVPGAGHVVPEEAPDVVSRTILRMAAAVLPPPRG